MKAIILTTSLLCCLLAMVGIPACNHPINLPTCLPIAIDTSLATGNYWISNAFLSDQCLYVALSHGGGCAEHEYQLRWNGALAESAPPQAFLVLWHGDPGDPCDAIIQKDLFFDLTPLINEPYDQVILHLTGWDTPLMLQD